MRRFLGYLALSLIWTGVLSPFVAAAQLSTPHACCLRSGLHRCQQDSSETGFHAPKANCRYSTPVPLPTVTALELKQFNLSTPMTASFLVHAALACAYDASPNKQSARGPPLSL